MGTFTKVELKKQLQEMNIEIKGNYIRKKDIQFLVEAAWVKGDKLSSKAKEEVFNSYLYRWTKENYNRAKPLFEKLGSIPTIALISDEEWLASHAFKVNKDGSLSQNVKYTKPDYMIE